MNKFKEYIINYILGVFNGYDQSISDAVSILTTNLFSSSNQMYQASVAISDIIKPFAMTIMLLCFGISLLKTVMKFETLKMEFVFTVVTKYIIARASLELVFPLLNAIYSTAASFIAQAGNISVNIGATSSTLAQSYLSSCSWMEILAITSSTGIISLGIKIITTLIKVIAYGRTYEIYIFAAFSPLPFAFIPLEDGGSRIVRDFIFRFSGVCLQGLAIILSIDLFSIMCSTTFMSVVSGSGSFNDLMWNVLLASIVLVLAVVKSGQMAKSVFSVS